MLSRKRLRDIYPTVRDGGHDETDKLEKTLCLVARKDIKEAVAWKKGENVTDWRSYDCKTCKKDLEGAHKRGCEKGQNQFLSDEDEEESRKRYSKPLERYKTTSKNVPMPRWSIHLKNN